ncbi:MAG: hypothetical protein A2V70_03315 [Planctomycetes bacterium RBG_13_63_9]|nr:MAG: hypothetical protein A2V70_03315 [Planctomycetes bacterium RBG_13_63_9]
MDEAATPVLCPAARGIWRRWAGLLAGLATMGVFVFVIAPAVQHWRPVWAVHTFVEERGIDASALFYTESEEFGRVQRHMQDAMRFAPQPSQGKSHHTGGGG